MNSKSTRFIRNFLYTISSNLISLIISILVVLIIPKLIGIEEYGYWQLYIFYSSYVGFLHFGWSDGIYLRYGGENYNDLDKKAFSSQFYLMVFSQTIVAILIAISSEIIVEDENKIFILLMVAINLIIMNTLSVLVLTLQATNRIKEYARINLISRVLYIALIVAFLLFGLREYKIMIIADLVGKLFSLIYAIYSCKDIVFHKLNSFYIGISEALENIRVGSRLMFANIASMLIIGVVRFGIECSWDVATFGKISLTLSASNLLMIFINSIGIVIFPLLRKMDSKNLPEIYSIIRDLLMLVLLGVLLIYFPMKTALSKWLPNYAETLDYMALLFPISMYEGKMVLLINTYLKTLRKEMCIMMINISVLMLGVITTLFSTVIFRNLNFAIISILFVISIRSIIAEIYLSKILKVKVLRDIIYELILTVLFVLIGWNIDSNIGFIIYLIIFSLYVVMKGNKIQLAFKKIKGYMHS